MTMQLETEKIARELALRSKHKNEGLWELCLGTAVTIWMHDKQQAEAMIQAYDKRKKGKRKSPAQEGRGR